MITGVVSEQDFVEAQRIHRHRTAVWINAVLIAIALAGVVLLAAGTKKWGLIVAMGGIGGLIGEAIQARLYIPAQARKHYRQFKGIDAPITYRWSADTICVETNRGAGERSWSDFQRVRESNQLILLYTTDALFEVVPKRWFRDEKQAAEFSTLANGTARAVA